MMENYDILYIELNMQSEVEDMDSELKELLRKLLAEQVKTNKLLKNIKTEIGKTNRLIDDGLGGLEFVCENLEQQRGLVEALFTREVIRDYYDDYLDKCEENGTDPLSFSTYYSLITQADNDLTLDDKNEEEETEENERHSITTIVTSSDGRYN